MTTTPKPGSRAHLDQYLKTRGDGTRRSTDPASGTPKPEQKGSTNRRR